MLVLYIVVIVTQGVLMENLSYRKKATIYQKLLEQNPPLPLFAAVAASSIY